MARLPRFRSIQVSMAFAFSLLSVLMIALAVLISYTLTEEVAGMGALRYTRQLVAQTARNIESYIDHMDSVSAVAKSSGDVAAFLADPDDGEARERAGEVLAAVARGRKDISLVAVFPAKGGFVAHDPSIELNPFVDPRRQSWWTAALASGGAPAVSSSQVQNAVKGRYRWVISLSREAAAPDGSTGVLLVDLNFSVIEDACGSVSLGERGYIFVVDAEGDIVYHPQQQLIYGGLKDEDIARVMAGGDERFSSGLPGGKAGKLYSVRTMRSTGWRIVGVNFPDELVENRESIRLTYAAWGLGFFATVVALSIFLSSRISKPIKGLRRSMRAVEFGDFDVRAAYSGDDEIGQLGRDFDIMVAKIRELVAQNTRQQELKRESELKALQMQINPHFLYNTLDSVIWMAEGGKRREVIEMTSALARLFRLGISKGQEVIDVRSEIEHVTNYLIIQKIRYKDRLDYAVEVDPSILGCRTVKIILQPLAENAIYHGVKNKPEGGRVTVRGRRTAGGIELSVEDDGIGMDAEELALLRRRLAAGPEDGGAASARPGRGGLGVKNVDERIKLYFGPDYGLEFESGEGRGTVARARLPFGEEGARA